MTIAESVDLRWSMSRRVGLSSVQDTGLIEELFSFVLDGARDHDIVPFFNALARNKATRRRLAEFTMQHFDIVGNLSLT